MSPSAVRLELARHVSYNPHTVQGAWTIVLTVILTVFVALLLLRLLAPVTPNLLTDDEELELLLAVPADHSEV